MKERYSKYQDPLHASLLLYVQSGCSRGPGVRTQVGVMSHVCLYKVCLLMWDMCVCVCVASHANVRCVRVREKPWQELVKVNWALG